MMSFFMLNKTKSGPGSYADEEKLERAKGFEPSAKPSETSQKQDSSGGCAQIRAQISDASCPDLSKVVASWPNLPAPFKAAILAIVKSVEDV
jgi:hypothetical protein